MGAIFKEAVIRGANLNSAFRELQDTDEEEKGNDIYSGGWNNATGIKELSKKEFDQYETDKHSPVVAFCVVKPIENDMKVKTTVTNFPNSATRKWETKYQVDDPTHGNVIVSESKQADAIRKARELVDKNPECSPLTVYISKQIKTDNKVAEVKYKKSSRQRNGVWKIKGELSY
tara:strand:+ start:23029 stop:23550 length:522 start_codon:yes stop_codon:yes gene_type:complete